MHQYLALLTWFASYLCMPPKRHHPAQVLSLLAPRDHETALRVADARGLELTGVSSVSDLLAHLATRTWSATVVSLGAEHVDVEVTRSIADYHSSGALILTAPP